MGKKSETIYLVGDFETTVYDGQDKTEVWASAIVHIGTEDAKLFHSINDTFAYLCELCKHNHLVVYYHNLKFDGSFWLDYLIRDLKYKQAYLSINEGKQIYEWKDTRKMNNKEFQYMISDMGQWYSITIRINNHFIEFRDSLKLLPFSVKQIGESFGTKHKKTSIEYTGYRYAGCEITKEEEQYIFNDIFVVKEALEIMFEEGHKKLTIGSCCLAEFKRTLIKEDYEAWLPNLKNVKCPMDIPDNDADEYIRKSYRGGWCYLVHGKEHKVYKNGLTLDVNSLYSSMMSSESGNRYPIGIPSFWVGDYIPDEALKDNRYYFIRIKTRFKLKEGYLPFIQIKRSILYKSNEMLETSDINGCRYYQMPDGQYYDSTVIMTLTMTDYELLKEHYYLYDFQILSGCYFWAMVGLFDEYINHYKQIKMTSKGARRELAKLFLNNLYGKTASSDNSSFKIAYLNPEDDLIHFKIVSEHNKKVGYIPIGSAITSYARNFTIRTAQKNYYGKDKAGFIYADTDSIHCDLPFEEIKGVKVDANAFCCWKCESLWNEAIFTRQKTYIEHITHKDLEPVDKPYYDIKCAGMPDKCKKLFAKSLEGVYKEYTAEELDAMEFDIDAIDKNPYNILDMSTEEAEFLSKQHTLSDFNYGLRVYGKLMPKRIKGGIVLQETTYEMRE